MATGQWQWPLAMGTADSDGIAGDVGIVVTKSIRLIAVPLVIDDDGFVDFIVVGF